jgi:hypothetical protein
MYFKLFHMEPGATIAFQVNHAAYFDFSRHHDKYNLRTADYDKMEPSFLRVLAFCILREQKPGANPPPYPFEC